MAKIAVQPIGAGNSGIEWTLIGREEFSFSGAEKTTLYSEGVSVQDGKHTFFLLVRLTATVTATKTVSGYNYDKAGTASIIVLGGNNYFTRTVEACAADTVGAVVSVSADENNLFTIEGVRNDDSSSFEHTYKVKFNTSAYGTGVASGTLEVFAGKFKIEGETL